MSRKRKKDYDYIQDEEEVARVIYSPSFIEDGRVSPTAFTLDHLPSGDSEDYVSVLRNDGNHDLNAETKSFRPRKEGDSRFGYSLLKVGEIRIVCKEPDMTSNKVIVDVLHCPTRKLSNHAGIFINH